MSDLTFWDWAIAGFAVAGLIILTRGGMFRSSRWWSLPCFAISFGLIFLRDRLGVDAPFP